ncbi:hypothetical protein [Streptomyces sp. NPDC004284]|uniref:hypothetical protein n=1 Tax=Streptomyces sp. NPDC004284 TaxID=3364695 RepID=UPI0036808743
MPPRTSTTRRLGPAAVGAVLPAGYQDDCAQAPSGGAVYGVCLADGPCTGNSPSATPADTVKLALRAGLKAKAGRNQAPDLVLTGINSAPTSPPPVRPTRRPATLTPHQEPLS